MASGERISERRGNLGAARGGIAVVLLTGLAAVTRLPHDTFLDGAIVTAIAALSLGGAYALWRLSRRASISG
ncbi:hypothetical protein [Ancylobacter sp. SL191]|uniref:hypothetical protein n=1 Tax=Ancylobacter sp. SL191 TaxID=2995166 RepID=UPI00227045B5|nr:hypothetical protein [Ancylobacter sp. SL191]WAC27720.1 hypothetical protein OU996_01155 [Ancylobacter sp. SL191]